MVNIDAHVEIFSRKVGHSLNSFEVIQPLSEEEGRGL